MYLLCQCLGITVEEPNVAAMLAERYLSPTKRGLHTLLGYDYWGIAPDHGLDVSPFQPLTARLEVPGAIDWSAQTIELRSRGKGRRGLSVQIQDKFASNTSRYTLCPTNNDMSAKLRHILDMLNGVRERTVSYPASTAKSHPYALGTKPLYIFETSEPIGTLCYDARPGDRLAALHVTSQAHVYTIYLVTRHRQVVGFALLDFDILYHIAQQSGSEGEHFQTQHDVNDLIAMVCLHNMYASLTNVREKRAWAERILWTRPSQSRYSTRI